MNVGSTHSKTTFWSDVHNGENGFIQYGISNIFARLSIGRHLS